MNVALRPSAARPAMTREEFLQWAAGQEERYEFDETGPLLMGGGTLDHDTITFNIRAALHAKLLSTACRAFGPNAGMATVGNRVRYPDVLVSCTNVPGSALLVPDPVVVFEVLSPWSEHMDRIVKVPEYRDVPSVRRYLIVERRSIGITVLHRDAGHGNWSVATLMSGNTLSMPEIGAEVLVDSFYAGLDIPANPGAADPQPTA